MGLGVTRRFDPRRDMKLVLELAELSVEVRRELEEPLKDEKLLEDLEKLEKSEPSEVLDKPQPIMSAVMDVCVCVCLRCLALYHVCVRE